MEGAGARIAWILRVVDMSRSIAVKQTLGLLLAASPYALALVTQGAPAKKVDFKKEIAPLFKAHCNSCHAGSKAAGGLDLSTVKGIQKGGASGKLVVAGKPDQSLLMKRILGKGGLPRMPMGFAPLTADQTDTIKRWIAGGASTAGGNEKHWAYLPIARPALPNVKHQGWVKNPVDAFILEKMEAEGLAPSPAASRETLLRRVTIDLTGLPPTLAELDAFLSDKRPDAYERAVDRLLQSPHYGEKQAQQWLDLARYADTDGYEKDLNRVAWKYRDWVINAFNQNMPYDRFTIEQLAGDMLPSPTMDQMIATGFHRNTMFNSEGGVDPAEARYEMVNDRVATTSGVWLGQTMQCSRCHDHKYDPFTQKDYFRLYAIFSNTEYEKRGDPAFGDGKFYEPSMEAPSPEQAAQRKRLQAELAAVEAKYKASTPELTQERSEWETAVRRDPGWSFANVSKVQCAEVGLRRLDDGSIFVDGKPASATFEVSFKGDGHPITAVRLEALPGDAFPNKGPGISVNGNFVLSKVEMVARGKPVKIRNAVTDFSQDGYPVEGLFDDNVNTGWAVHPQYGKPHQAIFFLDQPLTLAPGEELTVKLIHNSTNWPMHLIGHFRVTVSGETRTDILAVPATIREKVLKGESADDYFRSVCKTLEPARKLRGEVQKQLDTLNQQIPMALILKEKPATGALTASIHPRGEFLKTGEQVQAGTPALFGPSSVTNRLKLAQWLMDPKNPLTARVEVNRIWEQYFGRGLVETSENFGTQGAPPTHPKLLDWLATKLIDSKWNLKAIHRLIVTSATYRQSSNATAKLLEKDPTNILYARGPRVRMDAETIRDNALSAAGLLSDKIGGPSVFPYQPEGIWNSPYNGARWMDSKGGDRYRRGLYTFWKRTSPYPAFMNFDATSREECTIRRIRTNTPLQALNLLNDEAYLEAAKALAQRTAKMPGNRLVNAFRLCTCRKPTPAELNRLQTLLKVLEAKYKAEPLEAKKLARTPDDAAWTMVANVLLNLDETITKE